MPDSPPEETRSGARPARRSRLALVLGGLGLLLCWIPWAGLAVSAISLVAAIYLRGKGARVGWAVALGVWGLLLGLFFSGIVAIYPPARTTEADRQTWDAFERAFEEDNGGGAGASGS